jgi:hypothetical protein
MSKLVVDRVECRKSTDHSDDLYFLLMRFDTTCKVHRVGPRKSWANLVPGSDRTRDIVLVKDFNVDYLVATVEEDDSSDFDAPTMRTMSKALRLLYIGLKAVEPDPWKKIDYMLMYFGKVIEKMRTNDDPLWVQYVTGGDIMHVLGEGSDYKITLKVA